MASMNTRLNIEKLDGNIIQKHGCSNNLVLVLKQESMGYMMKNVFGLRSTQQCMKSGVTKHLGVTGIQQQSRGYNHVYISSEQGHHHQRLKTPIDMLGLFGWLASKRKRMLEPVKFSFGGIVGIDLWRFDDDTIKGSAYRNMSFNESREYKKTFIGSGVGTGSMQALQGDEFEVEPLDGHTFEVKPHGNVDHVVGSQEVQTQDLIYYHPARDREQHSVWEPFSIEKTVMRLLLQLLCNGDRNAVTTTMAITRSIHQSGNTLRVSRSRIHNEKLVQTLLKGHSILLLEGYLFRGTCDVEKNNRRTSFLWILTTPWVDQSQAAYMTLTGAWKKEIWLKGLLAESGYELSLVAGIATGALVKGGSRSEVPAQVEGAAYRVIEFRMELQLGLYVRLGKMLGLGYPTIGIRARLGPVVVWMVFPRLDPGSTVLVDPGKTLYRKEAGKKAGCSDGKGRRYEKGGIVAIVEGEAHGGLGLRGGLLGVQTQSHIGRIIISKLTYKLGGLLLLSPIGFRMEPQLGLYVRLGEMLGLGYPTIGIRARLGPVVVWMVFPRLDPGRQYEKGGIVAIVEGEVHGGLGLRGGLLGVKTQSHIDRIIILKLTYKLGGLLLLSPIGFRMEPQLGLYVRLGEILGLGSPTIGIRARLGLVVVWMMFPRLNPGSTVLVDPGKPCIERKQVKRRGVPMVKVGSMKRKCSHEAKVGELMYLEDLLVDMYSSEISSAVSEECFM
ncbi:hypothetical protein Tco_0882182 [Tanacetum coccineum]